MLKRALLFIAIISAVAAASDTTTTRLGDLEKKVNSALAKAGISFNGEFRSQYFSSGISGAGAIDSARKTESNEFTSVDFDIKARPNDAITGRLVFRMHQNWQNFFSDINNPIFSRWMSIDGGLAQGMFLYHAGDFSAKYSPLTLYSPDIDIMYEPASFKRMRDMAMSERFLNDNNRLLQGVNLGFDAEIAPIFNEFHLNILGARLRNIQTNLQNGSMVTAIFEKSLMQKLTADVNIETRFMQGISLGASYLTIFDQPESYRPYDINDFHAPDTFAQFTRIFSVRPSIDIAKFLSLKDWKLVAGLESAMSWDDSAYHTPDSVLHKLIIDGSAMDAGAKAVIPVNSDFGIKAAVSVINNTPNFRNELAQSPSFVGTRIMNTENDVYNKTIQGHYSTFDALYNSVFKFTPSGATNMWAKAPFTKNSYTNTIFTQKELTALRTSGILDPSLQLVMPFGPATQNRTGLKGNVGADLLNDKVSVKGIFTSVKEIEGQEGRVAFDATRDTVGTPKPTSFSQFGGGASIDLSAWLDASPWIGKRLPLVLSGSYILSKADNTGVNGLAYSPWTITSSFANYSLYWKFINKAALLFGTQIINNEIVQRQVTGTQQQMHIEGGLEWSVAPAADLVFTVGQIAVKNSDNTSIKLSGADPVKKDFTQGIVDLSLRIAF